MANMDSEDEARRKPPARKDARKANDCPGLRFPGLFGFLEEQSRRYQFRRLSRMAHAIHVRRALRGLRRKAPAAGESRGQGRRPLHRRLHRLGPERGTTRGRSHTRWAHAPPAQSRRPSARGDRRTPGFSARGRLGLPESGPFGRHALRRRGPAHSPGHADRFAPSRRALCAGRAFHRLARAR